MKVTINYRFIVGIDVAKNTLDIYLLDRKTSQGIQTQVSNEKQGFTQLGAWLGRQGADKSSTVFCSEHSGRYGEQLLAWTTKTGWPHAVTRTTALQKVSGEHGDKTDPTDAKGMAEYGARFSDRLQLQETPKHAIKQLKRLRAERRKMVDQRASLKQKRSEAGYHDADMSQILGMWEQQITLLTTHIEQIEQQIDELIREDPQLNDRYQTMRSAPGMGPVLGCFWLSLFAGQQSLNPSEISSRFGFAPHQHSSGSSVSNPTQSSGYGDPSLRRVFHQAARSVATHSPHYHDYYERKKAEGKHELVVINNIINKLIDLYCAMWNNRSIYDPNYIQKMNKQHKKSA